MRSKTWVWIFLRIFTGVIFAYAGFSKLIEPYENFRGMINNYEIIPYSWSTPLALTLPWVELVFGFFMILGYLPKITALGVASMTTMFLVALGASNALLDGAGKDCGCFGQSGPIHLKVWQVFIMDFLILLFSIKFYTLNDYPLSLHKLLTRKP